MRHHPVLWFGAASLGAYLALAALGPNYDAGGIRTVLFVVCYVVSFPFRWIDLVLRHLNGGDPTRFHLAITLTIGAAFIVGVDRLLSTMRR